VGPIRTPLGRNVIVPTGFSTCTVALLLLQKHLISSIVTAVSSELKTDSTIDYLRRRLERNNRAFVRMEDGARREI